jgi:hypothetical protein
MPDIHCKICNEPWDSYGLSHGDVKAWEADLIRKGFGCPCCLEKKEQYIKPPSLLIGYCYSCSKEITIDQDEFIYNGDKKELINNDILEYLKYIDNNLYCLNCAADMTTCDICGKWVNKENTFYNQDRNEERCEDCMDDITSCSSCGETDISSNMRFVDFKPYCSSCYGPDMEIQNESD